MSSSHGIQKSSQLSILLWFNGFHRGTDKVPSMPRKKSDKRKKKGAGRASVQTDPKETEKMN